MLLSRKELEAPILPALESAESVLFRSHCPHSGLQVAAGLVLEDGSVVHGTNYESASYGLTLCAERSALARAQAEGRIGKATALVLTARWKVDGKAPAPLSPCGACRQWLAELSVRLGRDLTIFAFWEKAARGRRWSARGLLPEAFTFDPAGDSL